MREAEHPGLSCPHLKTSSSLEDEVLIVDDTRVFHGKTRAMAKHLVVLWL